MQRFGVFFSQSWYVNLPSMQKELIRTTFELYAREERLNSQFSDYSFVIFPMSKAYEGFLKKFLYDSQLITSKMYVDKRFRIGRSLNPDLNPAHQEEDWVYPRLRQSCGEHLSRMLWDTWLQCRNQVFHYFPDNDRRLSLQAAGEYIELLAQTMEKTQECELQIVSKPNPVYNNTSRQASDQ
jgi:hypothetical protein